MVNILRHPDSRRDQYPPPFNPGGEIVMDNRNERADRRRRLRLQRSPGDALHCDVFGWKGLDDRCAPPQ